MPMPFEVILKALITVLSRLFMLATVHACAVVGLEGYIVDVEVDFNPRAGLPSFTIVGLPDTAVKESRERVRRRQEQRAAISEYGMSVFD